MAKKSKKKPYQIKIGNWYRVVSHGWTSWYWVRGLVSKFTGLYACETMTAHYEYEGWEIIKETSVNPINLQEMYQVTRGEFLRERLKIGAAIHKYCDPNYSKRMSAFKEICAQVGII